jgi:Zn-dependent protease with chaperone function
VACLRVGRFAVHGGLALAALPPALELAGARAFAHACHRSVSAGVPAAPGIGGVAAVALAASVTGSVRARRRNAAALRRLRVEPWLGRHRAEGDVEVVTLPCAERLAYAVPGRPDQVVLSDGLLGALDDDEAEAVLRHESAHLRHGHHDALTLARDLEAWMGWFAPARASVAVLRLAVERWADEDAGGASPSARPAVRRALVKTVALAVGPAPAFTDAGTIAARLDALAATPPAPSVPVRVAATGPLLGMCAVVVGGLGACALVAHEGAEGLLGRWPF